jgi:putative MFS transporter
MKSPPIEPPSGLDRSGDEAKGRILLDRMDRLPGWPLPRFDFVVLGLAYFFVFYDISDIGFGMPAIAKQYHLSGNDVKFVAVAIGLIGYIVGSNVIGALSDRRGRRMAFVTSLVVSGLGSLGCALATGIFSLSVWRFVTGIGVGAALNLATTYVGELSPPAQRGRLSVSTFMVGIIGQAVTPFVALALVPNFVIGWRILFGIGAVIGLGGVAFGMRLPESPRWLVERGRLAEAEVLINSMVARFDPAEMAASTAAVDKARSALVAGPLLAGGPHKFDGGTSNGDRAANEKMAPDNTVTVTHELLHGRYGRAVMAMMVMWFLWYIGNYGFLGDAATLFSGNGLGIGGSILYLAVGAIGYPVGAGIMVVTSDKIERKYLIFAATVLWLVGMLLVGTLADSAVVTIGSFLASLALGSYLQVAYTFTAENFPTRLRTRGFAMADGFGHLGGAVGALLLPTLVSDTTFFTGFAIIGGTGLVAGLIALGGPKASGRSLEEVTA